MNPWTRRAAGATAAAALGLGGLVAIAPPSEAATASCSALTTAVYKTVNPKIGDQLLTVSAGEYRSSISGHGFTSNHGVFGYVSKTPGAGLVPVTRMYNAKTVDFLWASSTSQIKAATLYGYQAQKVNFYAPAKASTCAGTVGVHKFAKGTHRRNAVTAADRKTLVAQGWKDVGVVFYVKPTAAQKAAAPAKPAPPKPAPAKPAPPKPAPAKPVTPPKPAPAPVITVTTGYGVPTGTKLKVVTGDLTVTKAGTVLDSIDLRGHLLVQADNVTVRNSVIRGGAAATKPKALIQAWWKAKNLKVVSSTLKATNRSLLIDGISGSNYTADRLDVSGVVDAAKVIGPNVTIRNSWFHDAIHSNNDPNQPDGKTHDDGIQLEGGSNVVIENNKIAGFHNAAIQVTQNYSATNGVTVRNNQLSGGGCQVNVTSKGRGGAGKAIYSFSIVNNGFGTGLFGGTCPMRLPKTSSFTVSGNYWLVSRLGAVANRF